ncbi:hypothetical protein F3P66_18835 [Agrobacterium fabrum]|uniref:Uncharacterized protein n=1 Tax=Agrobacterium fabrum (strain C58 / ATCC 33970) TaxID=176299 RepID=Q8U975_AGRFC|nr:hypothetical protein Atu3853 [Agrobacterium fabrum str. C58]QRM62415.1 hypothetical protein F3P66_18835 [Agrobacterium fabrum]TRB27449.1 hypothetical protein EXN51_19650 [Agrobacterium fabrum]
MFPLCAALLAGRPQVSVPTEDSGARLLDMSRVFHRLNPNFNFNALKVSLRLRSHPRRK